MCGTAFDLAYPPSSVLRTSEHKYCPSCLNKPVDMWTCWIPLTKLSGTMSRLQVLPTSHLTISGYERPLHNAKLLPGDFLIKQEQLQWQTPSRMELGDIVLFNLKTVHRANPHTSSFFRLSIDTRVCKS
jgi:ectoine hydroxylase-related dioxygenase (phytanoyl-CoA dioxygenase family)